MEHFFIYIYSDNDYLTINYFGNKCLTKIFCLFEQEDYFCY